MNTTRFLFVVAAAAAALVIPGTAAADPHYFVRAGNNLTGGEQFDSSTPVTAQSVSPIVQDFHVVFHSGQGFASAGPGVVRASGRATISVASTEEHGPPLCTVCLFTTGDGLATMTIDDIVISGPPGASTVPASLRLRVDGTFGTSAIASGPFLGFGASSISAALRIDVSRPGGCCYSFAGTITAGKAAYPDGRIDLSLEKTGLLDDSAGGDTVVTPVVDLPVGTPISVSARLDASAGVYFQVGGTSCHVDPQNQDAKCDPIRIDADGLSDWSHTVSFATSGPVFELPPGYTVSSPSAGIVDNRWTLGEPAPDTTPPAIACESPDDAWHAADVSLNCVASDDESGLADAGDASFSLSTAVAEGTETADAQTGSRQVCDTAGNCAVAGPIGGNKVDRKAPAISLDVPASQLYLLNAAVAASYDCADGGSGVASCAGPVPSAANVDTGSVGAKTFTVTAADAVGNQSSRSVDYTVGYDVKLLYDPAKPTRTVKLQLRDASGANVSSAAIVLQALSIDGSLPLNGTFTYVKWCTQYRFALPRGLSPGSHTLYFTAAGDPTVHAAVFRTR